MPRLPSPSVPVSWGELIDKITILAIKQDRIASPAARANVAAELAALRAAGAEVLARADLQPLIVELGQVNASLWEIEDAIRREEQRASFGPEFIRLARSVYHQNDRRAELKRAINHALQSELVEEKSYWTPPADPLPLAAQAA